MRRWIFTYIIYFSVLPIAIQTLRAQQIPDTSYRPRIEHPAFTFDKGPVVLIDEAHENFHTATGRYLPFAELLRRDGYAVESSASSLSLENLKKAKILVIANARKYLTAKETKSVVEWITGGGSLLLIADHPPNVSAAADLGKKLGIKFLEGTAKEPNGDGRIVFKKSEGLLKEHKITHDIYQVATFTGTSFQLERAGHPLLVFGSNIYSYKENNDSTSVQGHLQGAVIEFGKGKIAVFGEAAMFSAQLKGPEKNPMGMNAPIAKQNWQFLLNIIHWLTLKN